MNDYMIRATAAEGQIRAFAATTKELVEFARAAHKYQPCGDGSIGRLLTAGAHDGAYDEGRKGSSDIENSGRRTDRWNHCNGRC